MIKTVASSQKSTTFVILGQQSKKRFWKGTLTSHIVLSYNVNVILNVQSNKRDKSRAGPEGSQDGQP